MKACTICGQPCEPDGQLQCHCTENMSREQLLEVLIVEHGIEIMNLKKALDAVCLRCGTSVGMCPPGFRPISNGACARVEACPDCWKNWAMEQAAIKPDKQGEG